MSPTVVIHVRQNPESPWEEACRWVFFRGSPHWPAVGEEIVFTNVPRAARVRQVRHIVDGDYGRLQFINVYTDWL